MREKIKITTAKKRAKWLPKKIKRFESDESGATAVEFAAIAFPFFFLIFAILEASIMFFAGQYFEAAIDDTTRLMRTGELDNTTTNAQFRAELCSRIVALLDCNLITTDVQVAATFAGLNNPPQPDPTTGQLPPDTFMPPAPNVILQVSASYRWPVYTNFAAPLRFSPDRDFALMSVTSVVVTEPWNPS